MSHTTGRAYGDWIEVEGGLLSQHLAIASQGWIGTHATPCQSRPEYLSSSPVDDRVHVTPRSVVCSSVSSSPTNQPFSLWASFVRI